VEGSGLSWILTLRAAVIGSRDGISRMAFRGWHFEDGGMDRATWCQAWVQKGLMVPSEEVTAEERMKSGVSCVPTYLQ
jgi:hypothetical protein